MGRRMVDVQEAESSQTNQAQQSMHPLGPNGLIDRAEFIRLIQQQLIELGFSDVSELLQQRSQIEVEKPAVRKFRHLILEGDWEAAIQLLGELGIFDDSKRREATFYIYQQKFLEAAEQQQFETAMECLQRDVGSLEVQRSRQHFLAGCLLYSDPAELKEYMARAGYTDTSRTALLMALQALVPPSVMLPDRRLEVLVEQALSAQVNSQPYHNTQVHRPFSLLTDYRAGMEQVPSTTTLVLTDHQDEVWHVAFSPDGRFLATVSQDHHVHVYVVQGRKTFDLKHRMKLEIAGDDSNSQGKELKGSQCAWSPDGSMLAVAAEATCLVFDVASGQLLKGLRKHTREIMSVMWVPNTNELITTARESTMCTWHLPSGELLSSQQTNWVVDMAVNPSGSTKATAFQDRRVEVEDRANGVSRSYSLPDINPRTGKDTGTNMLPSSGLDFMITSVAVTRCGRFVLVHATKLVIYMYDIQRNSEQPCQSFHMPEDYSFGRYAVRSCFGGVGDKFVLSGSEDRQVYIFMRDTGELLHVLLGHDKTVNSVHWNPANPHMFVSCSDDKTVRIWGVDDEVAQELEARLGRLTI